MNNWSASEQTSASKEQLQLWYDVSKKHAHKLYFDWRKAAEEYSIAEKGQPDELSKAQERAQKLTEVVDHFLQWCELYDHTPAAYFHAKKVLKELQS